MDLRHITTELATKLHAAQQEAKQITAALHALHALNGGAIDKAPRVAVRRRKMSKAARQAISKRMAAYWQARRTENRAKIIKAAEKAAKGKR